MHNQLFTLFTLLLTLSVYSQNPEPAASYSGQYVIVNYSPYSCCADLGSFLRLYDTTSNKVIQEIQTQPGEPDEWNNIKLDSTKIQVKNLLNAREYYSMVSINKDSSKIIKQNLKTELCIEILLKDKRYESETFKIDSFIYDDSYCCLAMIEKGFECKKFPRIINIWMDVSEKMLLLEYGIIHDANGCDRGPFFKIVDLNKK